MTCFDEPVAGRKEFEDWFASQSISRLNVALERAIRKFDKEFIAYPTPEEYMEDPDFTELYVSEINHMWADDLLHDLNDRGLVDLSVCEDGEIMVSISEKGERYLVDNADIA